MHTVPPSDNIPDDELPVFVRNITTMVEPPFHISLSHEPLDDIVDVYMSTKGIHLTL